MKNCVLKLNKYAMKVKPVCELFYRFKLIFPNVQNLAIRQSVLKSRVNQFVVTQFQVKNPTGKLVFKTVLC